MNKQVITNFLKPKKSYSAIVEGETGTWTIIGNETMAFRQRYTPLFSDVRNEDGAAQINKLFDRFQKDAMQNVGLPTLREVKQYRKDCADVKRLRYYLDCGNSWSEWTTEVDCKQLEYILSCFRQDDELYAWSAGSLRPVMIWNANDTKEAVLMPLRPKEESK